MARVTSEPPVESLSVDELRAEVRSLRSLNERISIEKIRLAIEADRALTSLRGALKAAYARIVQLEKKSEKGSLTMGPPSNTSINEPIEVRSNQEAKTESVMAKIPPSHMMAHDTDEESGIDLDLFNEQPAPDPFESPRRYRVSTEMPPELVGGLTRVYSRKENETRIAENPASTSDGIPDVDDHDETGIGNSGTIIQFDDTLINDENHFPSTLRPLSVNPSFKNDGSNRNGRDSLAIMLAKHGIPVDDSPNIWSEEDESAPEDSAENRRREAYIQAYGAAAVRPEESAHGKRLSLDLFDNGLAGGSVNTPQNNPQGGLRSHSHAPKKFGNNLDLNAMESSLHEGGSDEMPVSTPVSVSASFTEKDEYPPNTFVFDKGVDDGDYTDDDAAPFMNVDDDDDFDRIPPEMPICGSSFWTETD